MNVDFPDMGGGIVQDLPPEQIQRNEWSNGNNVRFVRAQVSRISGHNEIFGTSSASGTIGSLALGKALYMQQSDDTNGTPWWVYCDLTKIYATDGTTHYNISNSATSTASMTDFAATNDYGWNGGNFNGLSILNSHAQPPRVWVPGATAQTTELSNWPASTTCRVLRPYKTFLMAMAVDEGSGFNEYVVRWPTAANIGAVPPSWDYADDTEDAGRVELADGYGKVIDGQQLRNDFFVYSEHAIYRFAPIPSNAIFDIHRQFSEVGVLTRNCIATVRDRHVFFGDGDIYVHDGQSMDSVVTKRWKNWVFSQIGSNWIRSYVAPNYENNEVWFCFPVGDDLYPTKALIWDFDDNTLSSRDLVDAAKGGAPFIAFGKKPTGGDDTFNGGPSYTFDDSAAPALAFNTTDSEINIQDLVMSQYYSSSASDNMSLFFELDSGNKFDDANYTSYVEKDCLPLNENGLFDQYHEYQLTAIRPRVRSTLGGDIAVKVYVRDSVGDSPVLAQSSNFTTNVDDKVDVRVTGTVFTVRFESVDSVDWELNGFGVDFEPVGSRPR